jgi:uncharacterized membrane protein
MLNALSQTANRDLMLQAREALKGRWGLAIGANAIYLVIAIAAQSIPKVGAGLGIIVGAPMIVGVSGFFLRLARKQDAQLVQIFEGIKRFGVCLGTYLLALVFVLLWALLLIIPGIMAAYSYAMVYFILAENDSIGPLEAIAKSKEMMRGNRWKLFCLGLRFWGWGILCILTLGIGFLWMLPYLYVAFARFYDDIQPSAEKIELARTGQAIMQ